MRVSGLSLRFKLTAWTVLVFGVLVVAMEGAWTYLFLETRKSQFDLQLQERATRALENMVGERPWSDEEVNSLAVTMSIFPFAGHYHLQVRDAEGKLVASSKGMDPDVLPAGQIAAAARSGGPVLATGERTRQDGSKVPLRVATYPFEAADGRIYFLQIATGSQDVTRTAQFARDFLTIGLPLTLVAAALAAWLLAGRVVSPLGRIADAARRVGPSNLAGRIDLGPAEVELDRLQRELNDALDRLEEGYRAQDRFISDVSHELKTPLAIALSELQVLRARRPSAADWERYAASIEEEMRRLASLVESFLTLARVHEGRVLSRRESLPVNDVVLGAIQRCDAIARGRGVHLVPRLAEEELAVDGDVDLLRTMVENLLRNAARFSPPSAGVDVVVEASGEVVAIRVSDRGPGVPEDAIEHLFDRYFQAAPDGEEPRSGSGLGLAIARRVAELHGGDVRAWNREEGGCSFEVRLPRAPAAAPHPAASAGADGKGGEGGRGPAALSSSAWQDRTRNGGSSA